MGFDSGEGVSTKDWKSEYAQQHSGKAPSAATAAGKPCAMAIAVAATGSDQFDSADPGDANDQTFDGVYSMEHAFKDTMSQVHFGSYNLSDSYKPKPKPPPPAAAMYKPWSTQSTSTFQDPKHKKAELASMTAHHYPGSVTLPPPA
mmetsp:Transcript_18950/g.47257  ORF Transcript_18950/g.47257 Transcript_18950/m.47257 type:complete len:146 (+) Transcript_18950:107-544(+)|eukprot:CAMPEP_0197595822 /NCGR_PEP_ID=MMETSP1326-20131121/23782_1 /TAXON_ID=1155430 /ORGANISM="Genus nov. species nov., Strain RCC2288" /LENGTH=145 /DNA_ID=CAMNT_0043162239 /DNA_START=115 /DNA_END=552 /DNA_ORIENTATION=+